MHIKDVFGYTAEGFVINLQAVNQWTTQNKSRMKNLMQFLN